MFLRRAEDGVASDVLREASRQSRSYFWQLQLAHYAIRAHDKELARTILERCRALAETCTLEAFPFAPNLQTPTLPILALLPEHALRAVTAISASLDRLPGGPYGSDVWYNCDPRLFHPHSYHVRRDKRADFYKSIWRFP